MNLILSISLILSLVFYGLKIFNHLKSMEVNDFASFIGSPFKIFFSMMPFVFNRKFNKYSSNAFNYLIASILMFIIMNLTALIMFS